MRKIFQVYINKKYYWVYDITGKEHEGPNGEPKTWWMYFLPDDMIDLPDGMNPPIDSEYWEPWHVSIERRVWEFHVVQNTSTKVKWGHNQFRCSTKIQMICNGKVVYAFNTGGGYLDYALGRIQALKVQLSEHPYNFFNPKEEEGRKIWYYGLPATVAPSEHYPGEISIIPDYNAGVSQREWYDRYHKLRSELTGGPDSDFPDEQEHFPITYINHGDALSDGKIWWFRKEVSNGNERDRDGANTGSI